MSDETLMDDAAAGGASSSPAATPAAAPAAVDGAAAQAASQDGGGDTQAGGGDTQAGASTEAGSGNDTIAGAPDSYEPLAFGDFQGGFELDSAITDQVAAVAKELNLPQDKANKMAGVVGEAIRNVAQATERSILNARKEWADSTRADPEIGGPKLQETLVAAHKARDAFASPALRDLLNATGLGNHPEMIRAFAKIGAAISEDKLVTGGSDPTARAADPEKRAQQMYPSMAS
jgi:hypothetical protein